jgi:hypothetical protein
MQDRINIYNHLEKAQEYYRIEKVVKDAQKKWKNIKGYFITVPDFHPKTEIFIREGDDKFVKIKEFKNKRSSVIIT